MRFRSFVRPSVRRLSRRRCNSINERREEGRKEGAAEFVSLLLPPPPPPPPPSNKLPSRARRSRFFPGPVRVRPPGATSSPNEDIVALIPSPPACSPLPSLPFVYAEKERPPTRAAVAVDPGSIHTYISFLPSLLPAPRSDRPSDQASAPPSRRHRGRCRGANDDDATIGHTRAHTRRYTLTDRA